MISIVDDVRKVGDQFLGDGKLLIISGKPFIVVSSKKILEGDIVLVEYTHKQGERGNGDFDCGTLTRIWDYSDGPYCAIDNKSIDLAGEGHTSNTYKVLAMESDFPSKYLKMIGDGLLKDGDKLSIQCRSIFTEELKTVTFNRLNIKLSNTTDEEEIHKIGKTKQLFLTLPITNEVLDGMKVVDKPIIIEEFESKIELFEMNELQKEAIRKWGGEDCLTLYPRGSVGYQTFAMSEKTRYDSTEFWCAMEKLDDLNVPRIDESNGETYSIVGRIMRLYKDATKPVE